MSLPSNVADDLAKALGEDIVSEVISIFKDHWAHISDQDKAEVRRVAYRFSELTILAKTGHDVADQLTIIDATISNWKAAGQIELYDAVWDALTRVVGLLGTFAGKTIRGFAGI